MQTVGAADILACGITARNSVSYGCLQWRVCQNSIYAG